MLDQVAEGVWVRQHTHTADSELIGSLGDLDEVLGDLLLGAQTPRPDLRQRLLRPGNW